MATQFDGSINIDTKLHTGGFNAGMKKVETTAQKSLNGVARNVAKSMGTVLNNVIGGFLKFVRNVGIGLIGLIGLAAAFGERMIDSIQRNIDAESMLYKQTQLLREQYFRLQASILSIFSTLLVAALPTIIKIVDWLVRMLDIVNQVIAALTGQKTVQRVIASSVKDTADASGKAAKNTEKMKKEAKGALAAFDQIDVLAQKAAEDTDMGAGAAGAGGFRFEEVPIDQKWLTFAEQIKAVWLNAIQAIKDAWVRFVEIWNAFWSSPFGQLIQALWQNFIDTWKRIIENTRETLARIKEHIETIMTGISQFVTGILTGDWRLAWEGIKKIVGGVMGVIFELVRGTITNILILFDGWKKQIGLVFGFLLEILKSTWTLIQVIAVGAVKTIQGAWASLGVWFRANVTEPIRNAFASLINWLVSAWQGFFHWLPSGWQNAFNTIVRIVQGALNNVISFVTHTINTIAAGINNILNLINSIRMPSLNFGGGGIIAGGVRLFGNVPLVPYLAQGAVIPPNAQFLAMLGDQRSGRNIEAPEELVRQIIREEMGNIKAQIEIEFTGSLSALARELQPEIKREEVRIGGTAIRKDKK